MGADFSLNSNDVRAVWGELRPHLIPTSPICSDRLDDAVGSGTKILLVSETFQHTGSFKFRAALSAALHSKAEHLLTASSGNFGAAIALAAARTGKRCTVVMPDKSAKVKIAAVRSHGATVDLIDTQRVSRKERLEQIKAVEPDAQVLSPYDDDYVIAGNSSLAGELFERETFDCIVAPIGGGGLSSGIVVGRDLLRPSCPVIGAEPLLANDAARSLKTGQLCSNEQEAPTLCDGARTLSLGQRNFAILRKGLAQIIEVSEDNIAQAIRWLFNLANLKAEPTGALSIAAVLQAPDRFAQKRVACIVSGGNVDPGLFADLISPTEYARGERT